MTDLKGSMDRNYSSYFAGWSTTIYLLTRFNTLILSVVEISTADDANLGSMLTTVNSGFWADEFSMSSTQLDVAVNPNLTL